ncbi:MAG: hypothetical protein WC496_00630 [Phycisphaerae bacterium]|jgi:ubiquitin-protein ligase
MDIIRIQNEFKEAQEYFSYIELHPTSDGKLYVKSAIQSSFTNYYILKIVFPDSYPYSMPSVYIEKPVINSSPHRYMEGNICYLHPTMWNPGIHNLSFVLQRAAKWLAKYEVWKNSNKWPGAQIVH